MRTDKTQLTSGGRTVGAGNDSSKLVSLLALAAGAAALPQTSNADIIYTDTSAAVSWEGLRSFVIDNLPGDSQLGFAAHQSGFFSSTSVRYITGGKRGGGYVQLKLALASKSSIWDNLIAGVATIASFASAGSTFFNGDNFSDLYLAFRFRDSTQVGNPLRYGWVGLNLVNGYLFTGNDFPKLTINGWAYEDSGSQIPMGATPPVPEPSSTALLVLGALAFGAKGVRSWRRNRAAASQS